VEGLPARQYGEKSDARTARPPCAGDCYRGDGGNAMADELHVVGVTEDRRLLHAIRRPDGGWQEFRDVGREAGRPAEGFTSAGCAVVAGA
ncbi:hypothetical protein DN554_30570, partial [Burkholderia multivorans]